MRRSEFDHALRAAASILNTDELLVIGSQAIQASIPGPLPQEAERSIEVDIAALDDQDGTQADIIDGSIGEASMFHETFGYYAQGVTASTAILPPGWRNRLIRYESAGVPGVTAWCLEPNDLWIAKAVAYRPKDIEFCLAMLRLGVVDTATLHQRLDTVDDLEPGVRQQISRLIDRTE